MNPKRAANPYPFIAILCCIVNVILAQPGVNRNSEVPPASHTVFPVNKANANIKTVNNSIATLSVNCNNWLYLPSQPSAVQVGQLNVTGTQITVEAEINRTLPYTPGTLEEGDVVSKHDNPGDVNYLLRPNHAYITTSNGFFATPDVCNIQLNKTYHIAMVYDGATLKYYRNGFLLSQVPASGTLFQNTWQTRIGYYFNQAYNSNFLGYINEVRIWNVARTQAQIQTYMNTSLPSPTTQIGLLAYYTFDNLLNKQGNTAWNGSIVGASVINQTNPTCASFTADNCCPPQGTLTGSTICNGNPATLTFSATAGTAPFILTYTDGINTYTQNNVQSGVPFTIPATLPNTTVFTLTSIQDASGCPPVSVSGFTAGPNIISNPDFSGGNTGFSSAYNYDPVNQTEGEYFVGTNPNAWNANAPASCGDHTTGNGNMMMINGASAINVNVWQETITVVPNTTYVFSTWIQSISPFSPAILQFSINGSPLGDVVNASPNTCVWNNFYTTWNSGNATTAIISLVNKNNAFVGNDFALDDIYFAQVLSLDNSTTVTVNNCQPVTCTNWLSLPTQPSAVEVGQLNIPGNQVTVEAMINRTTPYVGGILFAGDIVSKHKDPTDGNYLLRPNEAEITTTNGYFRTPDICEIELNKTYHVAMVYDGSTLKFYRNGFLMSQVAATGDLYQNTWPTRIGYYFAQVYNENFIGYINEVRIWNVARTQDQIKTYMNTSLPNPTTQPGLQAYYTFDNLINKQGNAAWNGTIVGGAVVNQPNPTCPSFIADSCCPALQGTITGSGPICAGTPATLTFNTTALTGPFILIYSDGVTTDTQTNVLSNVPFTLPVNPTATTTYTLLSIKDATTCGATAVTGVTATVTVNPAPQAKLTGGDICIGQDGVLLFTSTAGTGPFNITYTDGTNTFSPTGVNNNSAFVVPYTMTDTTTFTLTSITDANGCVSSPNTTTDINVNPLPQGGLTAGNPVCAGDSATLTFTATAGTAPFQVVLSDGTNSTTYYGIVSGTEFKITQLNATSTISLVSLTDQDGNGCTRTTGFISPDATITVYPLPQIQFDSLGSVCADKATFQISQATETSGVAGSGLFSGQGVDALGNFTAAQAGLGNHTITYTYTTSNGCTAAKSQDIFVNGNPVANAGQNLLVCLGIPVQLNASGGGTYLWTPPTGLSDPSIANPTLDISSSTTYTVTVTDSNGCTAKDSLVVAVSPVGKALYVVPNAFSPNGDGKNDCFGIQNWGGGVTLHEFAIFNRWGQRVFTTKNPSECWDGIFNGKMQDAGTYVYIINANTACGVISLKGTLVLVR